MLSALESFSEERGWNWTGVVGERPSASFMDAALTREGGVFIYCGHGGGGSWFSRSQVENLKCPVSRSADSSPVVKVCPCRAAVVLMGCSSGRLRSVNRKKLGAPRNAPSFFYEPKGISLTYLCAGAPCVVGNLWDVTDKDIDMYFCRPWQFNVVDMSTVFSHLPSLFFVTLYPFTIRYCVSLLECFLGIGEEVNIGQKDANLENCVADARSVCKMPSINGFAPVCFGVPAKQKIR